MKTYRLTQKLWAYVLALILCCCVICLALGCIAGAVYCYSEDWYNKEVSFEDSELCQYYLRKDACWVVEHVWTWMENKEAFSSPSSDMSYIIYDAYGNELGNTITENSRLSSLRIDFNRDSYASVYDTNVHDSSGMSDTQELQAKNYSMYVYLNYPFIPGSSYDVGLHIFTLLYALRSYYIPLAIVFGLLALSLFIFLMVSAGRSSGESQPQLRGLNRIPIDVYLLGVMLLLIGLWATIEPWFWWWPGSSGLILPVVLVGIGIFFTCVLCLLFLSAFAAQIKCRRLLRNTLIFRICHWIYQILLRIIHAIPLTWKAAVLYIGLVIPLRGSEPDLAFIVLCTGFIVVMLWVYQLRVLQKAGEILATGDLSYSVDTSKLWWCCKRHGENLNSISEGMNRAVAERMKSERMKTELITNVSHDIKTPLTSIINYIDLLKKEEIQNETVQGYIEVLDRQSQRLKKLTEDVVEASKASTGNIAVTLVQTDVAELLEQFVAEYEERFAAALLLPVISQIEDCHVLADSRLLGRVFDNLLGNVCKYAQEGTRIFLSAERYGDKVDISIKNTSRDILNISADELMERFVRGDSSRTGEGSGLGLSIAQSLIELQGGTFKLIIDGDLFKAIIELNRCE